MDQPLHVHELRTWYVLFYPFTMAIVKYLLRHVNALHFFLFPLKQQLNCMTVKLTENYFPF